MQSKICKCLAAALELMIYTHFKRSVRWGMGVLVEGVAALSGH